MSTPADQLPAPAAAPTDLPNIDPNLVRQFSGQQDMLNSDVQDYGSLAKKAESSAGEKFNQPPPERNMGIMSVAPYLIGLAALGGKGMGLHATTMLSATNGMVQGLIKGSEQRYNDEKQKYDDAYGKWLDKWKQQQTIYNEMRQVYKGRVDADMKAMEMTFKMMGLGEKFDMDTFKKALQSNQYSEKVREFNESEARKKADSQARLALLQRKLSETENPTLSPQDLQFMAQQYLAGDKSVMQNVGRGAQGSRNIVALRDAIREQAQAAGLSPAQVAGRMAEYTAVIAEERKVGGILGGVEFAGNEIKRFAPLVEQASAQVPRGKFVPFNKLIQIGEANMSDPNLKRFYVQVTGLLNAYDVLAARGGTDMAKREHNRQMLMTADSPEAVKIAIEAMQQEVDAARTAGKETKTQIASELELPTPGAAPTTPASAQPTFATEQDAAAAAAAGTLKAGDKITISGVSGTWH